MASIPKFYNVTTGTATAGTTTNASITTTTGDYYIVSTWRYGTVAVPTSDANVTFTLLHSAQVNGGLNPVTLYIYGGFCTSGKSGNVSFNVTSGLDQGFIIDRATGVNTTAPVAQVASGFSNSVGVVTYGSYVNAPYVFTNMTPTDAQWYSLGSNGAMVTQTTDVWDYEWNTSNFSSNVAALLVEFNGTPDAASGTDSGWILPRHAVTGADAGTSSGTAWTNPLNVLTLDGTSAQMITSGFASMMQLTTYYPVNLPAGKVLAGIEFRITGSATASGMTLQPVIYEPTGGTFGLAPLNLPSTTSAVTGGASTNLNTQNYSAVIANSTRFRVCWTQNSTFGSNTTSLDCIEAKFYWSDPPITVGPKTGTSAATSGGTVSWATPSNGLASDNNYTTHTTSTTAANMPYLNITGYDFSSIPDDATITGISLSIERKYSGGTTGNVRDNTVQLMKAGTRVGTNLAATSTNWGTTDTSIVYGNATFLWGTTWTPADIKNPNFGPSFRAIGNGTGANRVANVDSITVSVSYTGGTVVATDPYWGNVVAALHFNGTNGSTTMLDQTGRSWTAYNGAALSTTAPIMGSASLALDGTDDYIKSTTNLDDLRFGTGDFTIEVDFKPNSSSGGQILVDFLDSNMTAGWQIYLSGFGSGIGFYTDADFNYIEAGTHSWADGDWHQAVVTRTGGKLRIFLDGQLYATVNNTVNYNQTAPALVIGRQGYDLGYGFNGLIDEVRITNGVARYTAAFTTSETEFPHGAPSYATPPVYVGYSQSIGFTQAAVLNTWKSIGYSQTVGFSQAAALTTPKILGYAQSVSFSQAAALTTPKSLAYAQDVSFTQAAALTVTKMLAYAQTVDFSQSASLTIAGTVGYSQVISFTQAAALTTPKFLAYSQPISLTQAVTLTSPKALSYTQSIDLTQTAALTTPRALSYTQNVSFTQTAELNTGNAPAVPDFGGGGYVVEDPKVHRERGEKRRKIVEDLIDPKPVVVETETAPVAADETVELPPMSVEPFVFPIINITAEEVQMVADFLAQQRNLAMRQRIRDAIKGVGNDLHGRMPGM